MFRFNYRNPILDYIYEIIVKSHCPHEFETEDRRSVNHSSDVGCCILRQKFDRL